MSSLKDTMAALKGVRNRYQRGGGKTVKPKEGRNRIRLLKLPTLPGKIEFWRDLGVHWIKPGLGEKPVAVVGCPFVTYGRASELEPLIAKAAKAATTDEELKLVNEWKVKKAVIFAALVIDGPDKGPEAQMYEVTPATFGQILSIWETYAEEDVDITDPKVGVDLIIERRGKGLDTEYQVQAAPKSTEYDPEVLKKLPDVDAYIEREFFRGEEPKAIAAIEAAAGVSYGKALPAPASRSSLLTSTKPVEEPEVEKVVDAVDERLEVADAVAEIVESDPLPPEEPKAAAPKAEPKPAPAPAAKADDKFGADISADELDAVLEGLDDL